MEEGQTYQLSIVDNEYKYAEYFINHATFPNNGYYSTTSSIIGELTITYHDFDNAVLSGTFWFDAVNNEEEIIEIREGRFDMEY